MLWHVPHDPIQCCSKSVFSPNRLSACWFISNNERHSPSSTTQLKRHLQQPVADELRRSCFGTGNTLVNSQPNSILALLPFFVASGLTHAVNNIISSLKKSRLAVTPSFLQTDDVAVHHPVHAEDLRRAFHAMLSIYSLRSHVMGSDDELPSASAVTVVACLPSWRVPSRSPPALLVSGK